MKYLIVSDIHGSLPALEQVLKFYDEMACDMLCLLGDLLNYGPRNGLPEGLDAPGIAALLNERKNSIVAVRGNCDSEVDQMLLDFPLLADYALLVDEGVKIFLTHGHIYAPEASPALSADVFFSGHTHLWDLSKNNGTVFCNTGSPTFPKGGNPPTFALYENRKIKVFDLEGKELKSISF